MKIATYNINDVNKRIANLLDWLKSVRPDVACLQELKATDLEFPVAAIEKAGYGAVWRGQKSWNGVAILARGCEPVITHSTLPGDDSDKQSRYIEAAVNGVLIGTLYAPNGNPQPGPKFKFKLAWMKRLLAHADELYVLDAPVVLAGDYNVVPTDADIYPSKSYAKNALVQPAPRALFRRILDQGWVDAIRTMHPDAHMYTFWDYMRNRWQRDAGLRIDHLLLNPKAAQRLVDVGVDRDVRGIENASDHAPAWIMLRDTPAPPRSSRRSAEKAAQKERRRTARRAMPLARQPLLVIDGDFSRIDHTMRCRKRSSGAATSLPVPSLVLPMFCCASTARSSHVPCLWRGIRSKYLPTGMRNFPLTKVGANSMTPCLSNSGFCQTL